MTFIHSKIQKSILTKVVIGLMMLLFTGTFGLIVLYNKVVDLNHSISGSKAKLESIGVLSTKLNNQIIAATGGGQLTSLASADGLILETKPVYFSVQAVDKQTVAVK